MGLNMAYTNEQINQAVAMMHSTGRVRNFIRNAQRRNDAYAVEAGHKRIQEILAVERAGDSVFFNELMRYVEAYEQVLSGDSGKRRLARYTRPKIATHGALKTVLDLVRKPPKTYGLNLLQEGNRLDCAYENLIIDYSHAYPNDIRKSDVDEARKRLKRVQHLLPPFPILQDRT